MKVGGRKRGAGNGNKSETMVRQSNKNGKLTRKGKQTTKKTGRDEKGKDERQKRGKPHLHTRPTDDGMTKKRASLRLLSTHPKSDEGKLEGRFYSPA
jgi:hypothetical protein